MKNQYLYNGDMFIKTSDERYKKFQKIKKKTGVSPDELWSLDYSLAVFMVPRLKLFLKTLDSHPDSFKSINKWKSAIKEMIWYFEQIEIDPTFFKLNEEQLIRANKAQHIFADNIKNLWN